MRSFAELYAIAADRKGGVEALESMLARPAPAAELAAIPEDRWLSRFTRMVFSAGFNWTVIENKWQGFEDAFHGFDCDVCAMMDDTMLDGLLADTRIVRNGAKILSVRDNAVFLRELRAQGGAGTVIGGWPASDFAGLIHLLKTQGNRLGGTTGQYALRFMGVDSWVLSKDVVARLTAEGVIEGPATSRKAQKAIQEAFDTWRAESGRSLTEISRILAFTI